MGRLSITCALALLTLSGCGYGADETVTAYGAEGQSYRLIEIDGVPFAAEAYLRFPGPGQVAGDAPCNSFRGVLTLPYPWFGTDGLAVTRRACPDLDLETAFFSSIERMTVAEVSGGTLLLTAPGTSHEMLFQAE